VTNSPRIVGRDWRLTRAERDSLGFGLITLVGQAPSAATDGKPPLLGATGKAIASRAGLNFPVEYASVFDRVNLFPRWPGMNPRGGDEFDPLLGQAAAGDLSGEVNGRLCVLLGKRVARSFGLRDAPFYSFWLLGEAGCGYRAQYCPVDRNGPSPVIGLVLARDQQLRDDEKRRAAGDPTMLPAEVCQFHAFVVPHPSRVSRHWNTQRAVDRDRQFWRDLVQGARLCAAARFPEQELD